MRPTYILGISAFYHDSAACLLRDGAIVAAAQEERFTRKKGDSEFPRQAARYCLKAAGIQPGDLAYVGFYDNQAKFSHELIAGAASFEGFKLYEDHQRKEGMSSPFLACS